MPKNHHPTTRGGDSMKRPRISTAYSHEFGMDMDGQDVAMGNGHEVKDPNEGSVAGQGNQSSNHPGMHSSQETTTDNHRTPVLTISDPGTTMDGLQIHGRIQDATGGESLTPNHKRKAEDDGLTLDMPTKVARKEDPADPCCVLCAIDLKCSKPRGVDTPCFRCFGMGKQHECVEVDARCRFQLRRLQNEAMAYISNPNQTTEEALDTAQEKLVKMIKSVRQQKPTSSKATPSNETAIENLFIRLAFKQDTYATNDLASLRDLPRLRNTLNIQGTKKFPSIASLDHTKAAHLEIVAAHLVGTAADKACSYCSKGEGFFRECIAVPDKGKLTFLGGACTNCAIACHTPCSLAEL
ncbi:MAG: hypothetical protein Q9176_006560 [Flavoplaca citrina]